MAVGLAAFTYYLGQESGKAAKAEELKTAYSEAFSECQTGGSWLLCPHHIKAIQAATP